MMTMHAFELQAVSVDGLHVLTYFVNEDDVVSGLGQLSTDDPANSTSPTHDKSHSVPLLIIQACEQVPNCMRIAGLLN
ncbi:hypothetical protein NKDENANG_03526 [Candidatus Entotheonellaceae bacterium PAL068K]